MYSLLFFCSRNENGGGSPQIDPHTAGDPQLCGSADRSATLRIYSKSVSLSVPEIRRLRICLRSATLWICRQIRNMRIYSKSVSLSAPEIRRRRICRRSAVLPADTFRACGVCFFAPALSLNITTVNPSPLRTIFFPTSVCLSVCI